MKFIIITIFFIPIYLWAGMWVEECTLDNDKKIRVEFPDSKDRIIIDSKYIAWRTEYFETPYQDNGFTLSLITHIYKNNSYTYHFKHPEAAHGESVTITNKWNKIFKGYCEVKGYRK